MSFRYENQGYDLTPAGTSGLVTAGVSNPSLYGGSKFSGCGFWQSDRAACFAIPSTGELWIKFDWYWISKYTASFFRIFNETSANDSTGIYCQPNLSDDNSDLTVWINGTNTQTLTDTHARRARKTYLLHIKTGTIDGVFELWIDGVSQYSYTGNVYNGNNLTNFFFQSDDTSGSKFSNVIISDEEIGLNEDAQKVEWKYRNLGTASGFASGTSGATVSTANSKFGTAFYQTARARMCTLYDVHAVPEIWIKCDVYNGGTTGQRIRIYNENSNACGISNGDSNVSNAVIWANNNNVNETANVFPAGEISTVLLHMVADGTNGLIECWVNNEKLQTYSGNVNTGWEFQNVYLQGDSSMLFSNVIISNTEIKLNENADGTFDNYSITNQYDTKRTIGSAVTLQGDTKRHLETTWTLEADTLRKTAGAVIIKGDTARNVANMVVLFGSTIRKKMLGLVRLNGDTRRKKTALLIVHAHGHENTTGTESINFTLSERTISDTFSFTTTSRFNIGDRISGELLDFAYQFDVESTSHQNLLQTVNGLYSQETLLNQPLVFKVKESDCEYYRARIQPSNYAVNGRTKGIYAKKLMEKVAGGLDMPLVMEFDDFVPSAYQPSYSAEYEETNNTKELMDVTTAAGKKIIGYTYSGEHIEFGGKVFPLVETFEDYEAFTTYNSILSSLFSWADAAPRLQVNVFIRNGTIYALQRGKETDVINLTVLPHTRPRFDREICRTMWAGNPNASEGGSEFQWGDWYVANKEYEPPNINYPREPIQTLDRTNADGSTTNATFEYDKRDRGQWLQHAKVINYSGAGGVTESNTDYETFDTGQRFGHTYIYNLGNGGSGNGSGTGGNGGGTAIPVADTLDNYEYPDFPNELNRKQRLKSVSYKQNYDWKTVEGDAIAGSSSIDVEDAGTRQKIYEEIVWMNGKTREDVQVDIIDNIVNSQHTINHIFDFFSRYELDGNEYYLVSNNVSMTPREFRQSLHLVRWY